jgi:Zn-dependent protease with chaperone function
MTQQVLKKQTPDRRELQEKIVAGFHGNIPPRPVPFHYRIGLLIAAITMLLLPLVYVGLIGLASYGVYWHATENHTVFEQSGNSRRSRRNNDKAALVFYVVPLVVGGILVVFMIKPLFARRGKSSERRKLDPKREPVLFAFVERVCKVVGAPVPREIHVDCDVNASAGFRKGMFSLLGNDLVLTIGMPLAAGLSLQEFAGVLGHEFGHFAQRAGMRLTFIVRSVNGWFARVVYERDAWDEALVSWCDNDIRIAFIFYIARLFVWLTRKILWVLMMLGHVVSCYMLRQMEFDADRHETLLAGSKAFESTVYKLQMLGAATSRSHHDLKRFWSERRLADDLPAFIMAEMRFMPKDIGQKIEQHIKTTKTGLFDTHPADSERIAAARAIDSEGVFATDLPANALFCDYELLSKAATCDFYREILGSAVKPENLRPVSELVQQQDQEDEAGKVLQRFFHEQVSPLRPVLLPAGTIAAPADAESCIAELKETRTQMNAAKAEYSIALKRFSDLNRNHVARKLLGARKKIDYAKFDLPKAAMTAAGDGRSTIDQQNALGQKMQPFESSAGRRLFLALSLLQSEHVSAAIPKCAELRAEVARLLPVAALLGSVLPQLAELHNDVQAVMIILANVEGNEEDQEFIGAFRTRAGSIRTMLSRIHTELGQTPYPFEHQKKGVLLSDFAIEEIPHADALGECVQAGEEARDRLFTVYFRILGRLVLAAEAVELALNSHAAPSKPAVSHFAAPEVPVGARPTRTTGVVPPPTKPPVIPPKPKNNFAPPE